LFRKSLQFRCESVCLYFLKQIPAWRGEKVWFGGVFQPVGAWPPGEPCAGGRGGCRRGDLKSAVGAACVGRPKNRVALAVLTTRRGRDRRGSRAPYGSGECRGDWKSAVGAWCSLQGQLPQECAGGAKLNCGVRCTCPMWGGGCATGRGACRCVGCVRRIRVSAGGGGVSARREVRN
jgi:hypothetical protein